MSSTIGISNSPQPATEFDSYQSEPGKITEENKESVSRESLPSDTLSVQSDSLPLSIQTALQYFDAQSTNSTNSDLLKPDFEDHIQSGLVQFISKSDFGQDVNLPEESAFDESESGEHSMVENKHNTYRQMSYQPEPRQIVSEQQQKRINVQKLRQLQSQPQKGRTVQKLRQLQSQQLDAGVSEQAKRLLADTLPEIWAHICLLVISLVKGRDSIHLLPFLDRLSSTYQEKQNYSFAESACQRALTIREKYFGQGHPELAGNMFSRALIYQAQGNTERSRECFEQALELYSIKLHKALFLFSQGTISQAQIVKNVEEHNNCLRAFIQGHFSASADRNQSIETNKQFLRLVQDIVSCQDRKENKLLSDKIRAYLALVDKLKNS